MMTSTGPAGKTIRGSADQIADKYLTLAEDAQRAGDHNAETLFQHADHWRRIAAA
ncbi:DUF4167 domain-containing protein [Roseicella sp. DB1501]|uniref:DUF4167 domain-containing protein n=1 Tax=Roseicella sp. DB1501 TaxID=2730925 RepID=UPI001C2BE5E0|nr:DUF4167 domain-containing protein [Roseicella sp. DB1501]